MSTPSDLRDLKLVITGGFGFMDIGDEAMLTEHLHHLTGALGMAPGNLWLFGHDPDYVGAYHRHPPERCIASDRLARHGRALERRTLGLLHAGGRRLRGALGGPDTGRRDAGVARILDGADAALVTGGGIINSRDAAGYSINRMHDMVAALRAHGLPVFISGQTIGPLGEHPAHDALARRIVGGAEVLTVRDRLYSRRYLDLIGAEPAELIETVDDACTLEAGGFPLPEATAAFLAGKGAKAAVNVTDYTSDTAEQRALVAGLCEWLVREEGMAVLMLAHTPRDLVRLYRIHDMCAPELRDRIHLPDTRYWRGEQLKAAIAGCDVAIGGRYHFVVFAGTAGTPFVGMAGNHYSYIKQHGFADPLGLARFVLTERQTWEIGTVQARVREARSRAPERPGFARPLPSMAALGDWLGRVAAQRPAVVSAG